MEKVSIFFDQEGQTLTVWFGDRTAEYISAETGDEIILMKNQQGQVIGFEKLNYRPGLGAEQRLKVEAVTL